MVRRYWHMRFCSVACMAAYQRRLHDATKQKIAKIRDGASAHHKQPRVSARLVEPRARTDSARRLAG
jgi:hypothetical protein